MKLKRPEIDTALIGIEQYLKHIGFNCRRHTTHGENTLTVYTLKKAKWWHFFFKETRYLFINFEKYEVVAWSFPQTAIKIISFIEKELDREFTIDFRDCACELYYTTENY